MIMLAFVPNKVRSSRLPKASVSDSLGPWRDYLRKSQTHDCCHEFIVVSVSCHREIVSQKAEAFLVLRYRGIQKVLMVSKSGKG